jgi:hypothetical protein
MQGLPLDWRGASFCQGGECVWIGAENGAVIMRSSQPDSAWIYFTLTSSAASSTRPRQGNTIGPGDRADLGHDVVVYLADSAS